MNWWVLLLPKDLVRTVAPVVALVPFVLGAKAPTDPCDADDEDYAAARSENFA